MYRTRKQINEYNPSRKRKVLYSNESKCPFCHIKNREVISKGKHSMIITNIYNYNYWDHFKVKEHLLLIPKRHIESLSELNADEKTEYMDKISDYEGKGFNIFARDKASLTKSVPHQHIHLIKTDKSSTKFMLYLKKPYLLWRY